MNHSQEPQDQADSEDIDAVPEGAGFADRDDLESLTKVLGSGPMSANDEDDGHVDLFGGSGPLSC